MAATPEELLRLYEAALAAQDWPAVAALTHPQVCVTFSNGAVHEGLGAVKTAFLHNFSVIRSERYTISNLRWSLRTDTVAVCLFDYHWSGLINGQPAGGSSRGTHTLVRHDGEWLLAAEHLTRAG